MLGSDFAGQRLQPFGRARDKCKFDAFRGKSSRDCSANAGVCAGHDHCLVFQAFIHLRLPIVARRSTQQDISAADQAKQAVASARLTAPLARGQSALMSPVLIAIDWGSSSFRAYLMSADAEVLDEVASSDGIATVAAGAYPATLKRVIERWLEAHPSLPVIASGMVGSRHGWREAPYVKCPARPSDVAAHLIQVEADGRRVALAPGLSYIDESGQPDVIRGEETEIFGAADSGARLIVLPGSHSKWARVDGDLVAGFRTFVTGELFAALRDHTIVGAFARAASPKSPGEAFALGVRRGAAAASCEGKSGLLGLLFGARALPLMRALSDDDAGEYLSGLLIGAEIGEGRRLSPGETPHVAGAEALVERYLAAFQALDVSARAAPPRAAARGLFRIARDGGLL
jgi:2-dehydro-3-deoxygalactonokinase